MSLYREQLEAWLKTIDVRARSVLDIGGSANPIQGRTKSWEVNRYVILDNDNEKEWHDKWTDAHIFGDIEDAIYDREYLWPGEGIENYTIGRSMFDAIFCLEVFEYFTNPRSVINNIGYYLKKGGVAYISFPTLYPLHNPVDSDSLRYTVSGIRALFDNQNRPGGAKFTIREIVARKATAGREALAEFYRLEGMRAVKNTDAIYDIGYMVKARKSG